MLLGDEGVHIFLFRWFGMNGFAWVVRIFLKSPTVDDRIKRWVDKIENKTVRARVPVLLGIRYVLQFASFSYEDSCET